MIKRPREFFGVCLIAILFSSCISFRSEIDGNFTERAPQTAPVSAVSVFFLFTHLEQEKGFDVVPKIIPPRRGFRDIFGESMKQLSNVRSFATFTDNDNDIDNVERRKVRDSLKTSNDFTIHITIKQENSFTKHVLASIFTYGTLGLVPFAYSWDYIVTADVRTAAGASVKSYQRISTLTTWYHDLFLFLYPFLPSEGKREEIYLESLQNIFAQIEAEGVLVKK